MNSSNTMTKDDKKRLWIFIAMAYGLSLLMSIPMYIGYKHGIDIGVFPTAKMMYPACGVVLGILLTRKDIKSFPLAGYVLILASTVLLMILSLWSVFSEFKNADIIAEAVACVFGLITYIVFWACGRDKQERAGIRRKNIKKSILMIALFLVLYVINVIITTYLTGLRDGDVTDQLAQLVDPFKKVKTWLLLFGIIISFPLSFIFFFGEEYGWRHYLQPIMQKKYGPIGGILLLGVVWALWHLDVDLMYYTKECKIQMVLSQIITCVAYAIFFGYAYLKTQNIWVPIIMHYLNNNLIAVLSEGDVSFLENQVITWGDIPIQLVTSIIFVVFIFSPVFRKKKETIECVGNESINIENQ